MAFESHPPLFVSHSLISFSQKFPLYPIPEQLQYAASVSVLSIQIPLFVQFNVSHPILFIYYYLLSLKESKIKRTSKINSFTIFSNITSTNTS